MKDYTYRVIIEPDEDGFHGFVPALPGCHTHGKTIEETRAHLREAMELYLEHLQDESKVIPEENGLELLETVSIAAHA